MSDPGKQLDPLDRITVTRGITYREVHLTRPQRFGRRLYAILAALRLVRP